MNTGMFENGEQVGEWKTYTPEGKLLEEGFFDNGIYKVINSWNSKGQHVVEGNGLYKIFSEVSGNLIEAGKITDGLRSGNWVYYDDSLQYKTNEMNYVDGLHDGESIQYYEDGTVAVSVLFEKGKMNGISRWFNFNGIKTSEANFVDDKKVGIQGFWSPSGVLTKEEVYENGILVKTNVM